MIRKETKQGDERTVFYLIEDSINVSAIISELSQMGCKGDELGEAYRKLTSDNKGYIYENKETKEKLIVIEEKNLNFDCMSNPFMYLVFMLFMMRPWGNNPYSSFIEEMKKDGEEIK